MNKIKIQSFVIILAACLATALPSISKEKNLNSNDQSKKLTDIDSSKLLSTVDMPEMKGLVEEIVQKVAQDSQANVLRCQENQYFDDVTDTCADCNELCQNAEPRFCQVYCPWEYSNKKYEVELQRIWIVICVFAVLTFLLLAWTVWKCISKRPKKNGRYSPSPPIYDSKEGFPLTRTHSTCSFRSDIHNPVVPKDGEPADRDAHFPEQKRNFPEASLDTSYNPTSNRAVRTNEITKDHQQADEKERKPGHPKQEQGFPSTSESTSYGRQQQFSTTGHPPSADQTYYTNIKSTM